MQAGWCRMPDIATVDFRGGIDAGTPLLLFPMRIETRFTDAADGSALLVRIYPDQISVDSHEPDLTAGEVADGKQYWNIVWRAGTTNDTPVRAAWSSLVGTYHAPRADWIVRQTTPVNLAAR